MTSAGKPPTTERTRTPFGGDTFAQLRRAILPMLGLWTLSVAMPIFDIVGHSPTFLVAHDLAGYRLFMYSLAIVMLAPVALGATGYALRKHSNKLAIIYLLATYTTLLFAFFVLVFDGMRSPILFVAALVVCGGLALVLLRPAMQRFANVFGIILPVVALTLFLGILPSSRLVLPTSDSGDQPTSTSPNPAFIVAFDEFPLTSLLNNDLDIDKQLFPNFHKLSRQSTWYKSARTVSTSTDRAIPALLTGDPPGEEDASLPIATNHPDNLFSIMDDREISAIEPISRLCQYSNCNSAARPMSSGTWSRIAKDTAIVAMHQFAPPKYRERLPPIDQGWANFGNESATRTPTRNDAPSESREEHRERVRQAVWSDATSSVNQYMDAIANAGPKSTVFGHFMLPHAPWIYLPSGQVYQDDRAAELGKGPDGTWGDDPWLVAHAYRRHILQAQFADAVLGDIVGAIKEAELWEEAVIVVVSDHGIGFEASSPRRRRDPATQTDVYSVPLFVKLPGQRDFTPSTYPAFITDVAPTIAAAIQAVPSPTFPDAVVLDPQRLKGGLSRSFQNFAHLPDVRPSELAEAARRKYDLFGDGDGALNPYAIGEYRSLAGRTIGSLEVGLPVAESHTAIASGAVSSLRSSRRTDSYLPVLIEGTLEGGRASEGSELVFVLNGKVAGFAKPFRSDQEQRLRFQTLIDPQFLSATSDNHLDVYLAEGAEGGPVQLQVVQMREVAP